MARNSSKQSKRKAAAAHTQHFEQPTAATRAAPELRKAATVSRRRWLGALVGSAVVGTVAAVVIGMRIRAAPAEPLIKLTVYKSPSCVCCQKWVEHLLANGFEVTVESVSTPEGRRSVRQRLGIPEHLESCHTAVAGGYFVEGHVPAEAIKRVLDNRPRFKGIAVPKMPNGSPGMEGYGPAQHYDVMALTNDGATISYLRW